MDLTPQKTQVQGVNGTMDFITSTGCKADHGFDPTTDKSTGLNGSMSLTPQQTKVQGVNGTMHLTPQQTEVKG